MKKSSHASEGVSEHSLRLATTALLIEMMKADAQINEEERLLVRKTIRSKFDLSNEESNELLRCAEQEIKNATDYYEFTHRINEGFSYQQKVKMVENLWEIAFSDRSLDKYEEHMVRKIADLIYVEHKDFIDAKLRVKKRLSQ